MQMKPCTEICRFDWIDFEAAELNFDGLIGRHGLPRARIAAEHGGHPKPRNPATVETPKLFGRYMAQGITSFSADLAFCEVWVHQWSEGWFAQICPANHDCGECSGTLMSFDKLESAQAAADATEGWLRMVAGDIVAGTVYPTVWP